jgi:hypothetical protein
MIDIFPAPSIFLRLVNLVAVPIYFLAVLILLGWIAAKIPDDAWPR